MKWMKETLDSVTASDMPSTVVVVDNKPTDGTGGDATYTVNQIIVTYEGKHFHLCFASYHICQLTRLWMRNRRKEIFLLPPDQ
jgi:hypothetical protein